MVELKLEDRLDMKILAKAPAEALRVGSPRSGAPAFAGNWLIN